MRRVGSSLLVATATVLLVFAVNVCAAQEPQVTPLLFPSTSDTTPPPTPNNPLPSVAEGSLKVSLRLEDESPFVGAADVRLLPSEGYELLGIETGTEGDTLFTGLAAGDYTVEAFAPGYLVVNVKTQIEAGRRQRTLYVVMKPRPVKVTELAVPGEKPALVDTPAGANALVAASESAAASGRDFWMDHELERNIPTVEPGVGCPASQVMKGVAERTSEFVSNLEKFTATERVEHYASDPGKEAKTPERRKFAYVVMVSQNMVGTFLLDEYRDGTVDPTMFPANVATNGLSAMDLIFHPNLAGDFTFTCEGLGQANGKAAWQVHFAQRRDRPVRIRSYVIDKRSFSVYLEGRAWVDPGSFQVVRLETELEKPVPEIRLMKEHIIINYAPVEFLSRKRQIWLPQNAELYVERRGHRYYRTHVYSDFKLFNVDTAQNLDAPKGSYAFINTSNYAITGVLTVTPEEGVKHAPVSVKIVIPAQGRVFKVVGPGKDVNLPPAAVGSATFVHDGKAEWITVETNLVKETTLDVIPETSSEMKQ
jgi:hypothetical protein